MYGSIISIFISKLEDEFHSLWEKKIDNNRKLDLLRTIKKKFGYEEYLNCIHNIYDGDGNL